MSESVSHAPDVSLVSLAQEFQSELFNIGSWWTTHSLDNTHGGFVGEIGVDNRADANADKGIVLNARILWFFSEAARATGRVDYRDCAERAYQYVQTRFRDAEHGGYYWLLRVDGSVKGDKKQVYAQAFVIYALVAYYRLTDEQPALDAALECFALIEQHCVDRSGEGYYEAYTRRWGKIEDVRLSEKDLNYPKTMNTHLHVLEAYTELCKVHPTPAVKQALAYSIDLFDRYMIDRDNYHLRMFMDDNWADHSPGLTYGHDIECAWLLYKALQALGDKELEQRLTPDIIALAKTCQREASGELGEIFDGQDNATGQIHTERVWWVQAEALVGFLVAWRLSGDESLLRSALDVWTFIKTYQIDGEGGEWLWHSPLDEPDGSRDYKAGCWKGPYHNGRAMLEARRWLEKSH